MEKNKTHHVMFGFKYVILGGKQRSLPIKTRKEASFWVLPYKLW